MRWAVIICALLFGIWISGPAVAQDTSAPDLPVQVTTPTVVTHGQETVDVIDHSRVNPDADTAAVAPASIDEDGATVAITETAPLNATTTATTPDASSRSSAPDVETFTGAISRIDRAPQKAAPRASSPSLSFEHGPAESVRPEPSPAPNAVPVATAPPVTGDEPAPVPAPASPPETSPTFELLPAPDQATSTEHVDVIVEGERLSVRRTRTETDGVLIEGSPIFTHLRGKFSVEGAILSYKRFHDGARLSIDFTDGTVSAGDDVLGQLPDFEPREQASPWLDVNAIAVLTGTVVGTNEEGLTTFTLDDRLRPQFDLDLWVEGELQDTFGQEPRTIGPVLLLPLEVVVDALGHVLEVEGPVISVTRVQDAITLSLDLGSGLVSVNGDPRGVTPDISFADPNLLLLPSSAVETLTGTHVVLEPGSSRVDVNLDDRLTGGVLPGQLVSEVIGEAGLGVDSLEFQLSDRGPQRLALNGHYKTYTGRLEYESVGGFQSGAELQPGSVALNIQSSRNWEVTLGDQTTRFRETAGVGGSRLRGASWRSRKPSGAVLAIAAGLALDGFEQVSERASRPTFDGFVGGGRYLAADRRTELGLSTRVQDGTTQIVASGQTVLERSNDGKGLQDIFLTGDIGVFTGSPGRPVDARARASTRYRINEQVGLNATLSYDGPRFAGGGGFGDTNSGASSGSRAVANIGADVRAKRAVGPFDRLAGGVRTSFARTGGETGTSSLIVSASANGRVSNIDLNVAVDASQSFVRNQGASTASRQFGVRLLRRFNWGEIQATYNNASVSGEDSTNSLVANVSFESLRKRLGRGAELVFGPSVSGIVSDTTQSINAGARLGVNSGEAFGSRFRVSGQVSALQAVSAASTQQNFFTSAQASYRILRNTSLDLTYFDNLQGQRDLTIGLRGRIPLGSAPRLVKPREGRGLLQGRVFLDRNRDGIRQANEPGVPGAAIVISDTRLTLNADRDGNFTIVNVPEGLYDLRVQTRFLPLGFLVPEDAVTRATIGADRVTRLEIPVIASGQIRGTVFIDDNFNRVVDPGEHRLEGKTIKLVPLAEDSEPIFLPTVTFGQFSFEGVIPGEYRLEIEIGGTTQSLPVTVTEDELQQRIMFALPPAAPAGNTPAIATQVIADIE